MDADVRTTIQLYTLFAFNTSQLNFLCISITPQLSLILAFRSSSVERNNEEK